ncbi:MAG: ABC transporter ATP-binding protein [Clostridia bacterium]|nr:ABC transporter ATP-binding protein [Clostridia bacterium]
MDKTKEKIKKDNIFVRWAKLATPHKGYMTGQILFYCGYTAFLSIITIFAAQTINYMYAGNWTMAFIFLGLELFTIVARNVLIHFEVLFSGKQVMYIRNRVSNKIYNKILSCKNRELNDLSKEKIINIALNNQQHISEFPDKIANVIGYTFQVVLTLAIVFSANWIAGILVTILGIINFFAYYRFNKRLGNLLRSRYEKKDDMFKSYSKIIDGKAIINELNGSKKYEGEILNNVDSFSNYYATYYTVNSYKANLHFAFWNVIVYAISALMLYFVSDGQMDIAVYLVIVPYLKTCTEKLNALFDKTNDIENMRVDVDRINVILNLSNQELIEYGNLNLEQNEEYNLGLLDVCEYKKAGQPFDMKNINMNFRIGEINVVKGEKGSGKRVIFDMLRRYNRPDSGRVILDNLDLYDYNEKTFKTHITYCAAHPKFIDGTIKENLNIVQEDMQVIETMCEKLGIKEEIESLANGFNTKISDIDSSSILFMLGLVRALLTNCKILMVYEIPNDVPARFRANVNNFFKDVETDKTIILFTHTDTYDSIAQTVYKVEDGKVEKIK